MFHRNETVQKQMEGVRAHLMDTIGAEERRLEKAYQAGAADGIAEGRKIGYEECQRSIIKQNENGIEIIVEGADDGNEGHHIVKLRFHCPCFDAKLGIDME